MSGNGVGTSSVLEDSLANFGSPFMGKAARSRSADRFALNTSGVQSTHSMHPSGGDGARNAGGNAFLSMGDLVSFYSSESEGYLCSEGFTDSTCSLRGVEPGAAAPKEFQEAVFEILPRFRYESRSALARYEESQSYAAAEGEDDETLAALQKDCRDEDRDNDEETQRWFGVRIRYGQVIQLRHRQSGKFLGVTVKEQAKVEKQNLRVILEDGSEECRWIFNPRFKVRSEGEEINTRDQMLLLNSKYRFYLHVASGSSRHMGRREVNASNDYSTWSIAMFAQFTHGVSPLALKAGDVIQLFHREHERFMAKGTVSQGPMLGSATPFGGPSSHGSSDESEAVVLTPPDETSKGQTICHNSNSFWSIEFENPLVGGVCTFGGVFRFRHVATGLYLSGSKQVQQQLTFLDVGKKSLFRVSVVQDGTGPDTVFTLSSLNASDRSADPVLQDSFFVLRHRQCAVYVGAGDLVSGKDPNSPTSLIGINSDDEGNAFLFRPVPAQDVSMLHDAVGKVRFLTQFIRYQTQKQQDTAKVRKKQPRRGGSDSRESSFSSGQTMNFLSKGLIEMLQSLISSLEAHAEDKLVVRARQNLLRDQNALVLLTRLLESIFDKDTGIALDALSQPENFTLQTIVKLVYRLLELLLHENPDNQVLLSRKSHFIQAHIGVIAEAQRTLMLLFKDNSTLLHNITEKQMDFFLELIRTKGKESGFIRFLPILCSIKESPLSSNQLYLASKFLLPEAGFFPSFRHSEGATEVYLQLSELGDGWVVLEELEEQCSPLLFEYIIGSIDLLASLCMGRNSAVMQTVAKTLPMDLILAALRVPRLHAGLRAAFANVLLHAYVDADPQKVRPTVNYTRVWLHLDKSLVTASFNDSFGSIKKLAQLFLEHVSERDAATTPGYSLLLYRLLDLLHRMFQFGLYQEVNELQEMMPHLSRILGLKTQSRALMRLSRDSDAMLIEAKLKACQILDVILQFRLDVQITKLLVILKEQLEVGVTQPMENIVTLVLARLSFENEDHMQKVLSLFHYDHPPLSTSAAALLIRHNTQRAVLIEAYKQVQVLVSDESVKTYELVQRLVEQLRVLNSGDIDDLMVPQILDILKQWIKLCLNNEHRSENQRILFNLNAHSAVISLCKNPFHDIGVEEENQINVYSFHFMMNLCKGNSKIQMELFESFDFFSQYLDRVPRVAELLTEILRNNARNLMLISERQIQYLVNFVALGHRQARFLETLRACCTLNGTPVRRNQVMIMRLLVEQGKQTLVLFNDPESKSERDVMIRAGEYRDPHHIINYHIALLELLTTCCQGRIYEAEIKAQSLYSLEEIVDQLKDPVNLWAIKGRMIEFLLEVYFEAERISESVEFQSALWEIFSLISSALELYQTLSEELRKDEGYRYFIFSAVLPFFKVFFSNHYDHGRASAAHQLIVTRLVNELVQWLNTDILDLSDGKKVCLTVSEMLKPMKLFGGTATFSLGGASGIARAGFGTPSIAKKNSKGMALSGSGIIGTGSISLSGSSKRSPNSSGSSGTADSKSPTREVQAKLDALPSVDQMQRNVERWRSAHEISHTLSGNLNESAKETTADDGIHAEMRAFAKSLKQAMDLPGEMQRMAEILQAQMGTDITGIIISILSSKTTVAEGQSLVLRGLRGMRLIMESNSFQGANRAELQDRFNELRATQMMLQLLSTEDELVQLEALNFGIALLYGGNPNVQQTILDHFTDTADDEWFHNFRRLIRRVSDDVKNLYERQAVMVGGHDGEGDRQRKELKFKCEMLERIFRFLQLLCEGHFSGLQHFLRAQANNPKSYDLVTETVETLELLERSIDDHTVNAMKQMWISLTEYIQGPCHENQNVLISTKMCESANFLLQDELANVSDPDARRDLKEEVLLTLLSVMEGQSNLQVSIHLLRTLDFEMLRENLSKIWATYRKHAESGSELGMLGFRYYALLITLRDFEQDNRIPSVTRIEAIPGFSDMSRLIGRIEIVRHERMERVYFPIPEICRSIPERDKKHILWSVERTTQQQKIESFFKLSDHVISELKHLGEVRKEPMFAFLNAHHSLLQQASFIMALLINLAIVLGYHAPRGTSFERSELTISVWVSMLLFIMGLIQVFFSGLQLVTLLVGSGKLIVLRGWDQEGVSTVDWDEILADRAKLLRSIYFVFRDNNVIYRTLYLIFGILGVIIPNGYFFFAFHLFDMVVRNDILKSVLKSITFNWKQLVMTASFTSIIVYCYSIVGFLFFRKAFFIDEDTLDCETMLQCTVMMLYKGLRNGGGIGDVLAPPVWEQSRTGWRIVYDTSFWIICILILLNSFLGIIIDTFGELRSKDQAIMEDIESKCFICGVDRHRFDRLTAGFEVHIKNDHNMWHYLFFNVHLRRTEETEYTGPESFVDEMLSEQDLSFIPNQRAMCLESTREKGASSQLSLELEMIRGQSDQSMKELEVRFSSMQETFQEKMWTASEGNMSKISRLIADQNKAVESRLHAFDSRLSKLEESIHALAAAASAGMLSGSGTNRAPSRREKSVGPTKGDTMETSGTIAKKLESRAMSAASGKPSAQVLNKYMQKAAAASSDDDSSEDELLAVLNKSKKTTKDEDKSPKRESSAGEANVRESASGPPPADLMAKYSSAKAVDLSADSSEDPLLGALKTKKSTGGYQVGLGSSDEVKGETLTTSASGPPPADLMSKYTSGYTAAQSGSDSEDELLAGLSTKKSTGADAVGQPSANLMSKYGKAAVQSSDDSDSDDVLAALKPKTLAAASGASSSDQLATYGKLAVDSGTDSDSDDALAVLKSKGSPSSDSKRKYISTSANSDSEELRGVLRDSQIKTMAPASVRSLKNSAQANFLLSTHDSRDLTPEGSSDDELDLDPNRQLEDDTPLPDWTYKQEASDDDWLAGSGSGSRSPSEDDEERKRRLEEYMSQGAGQYRATRQLL